MYLFYSASQIKQMVILVDLSAIFLASPLSIFGKQFQWSVLFRDPIDLLLYCLSHTKHFDTIINTACMSFVRTLPFKFHQLADLLETFDDYVYIVNQIFSDRATRKYGFQAFTNFHLAHLQISRATFSRRNARKRFSDTVIRHFDPPSSPCAANSFPCYKRRDISRVSIPSGLSCATKIGVLRL